MPVVIIVKGIRFFFVSYDCSEPMHIHVSKDNNECKYWLRSANIIELAYNHGFSRKELNFIKKTISNNYELIKDTWNEYCKEHPTKKYRKK